MTQCFTCDTNLIELQTKFILYQCFVCNEKTAYCIPCTKIAAKLLSSKVFKCSICNSITKIMTKEEVILANDTSKEREVFFSPQSGFLSIETPNKSMTNKSFIFTTPRNSSIREEDCINDFSKLNLTLSNNEDALSQRYQLLRPRVKNTTPRKSDLLNQSHNESNIKSEFAGYHRKSKKITPISLRRMPEENQIIPKAIAEQSKLASIAIQKINFSKGYDESDKPIYGVRCQLSDSQQKFSMNMNQIPNITSSSFKLN